MITVLFKLIPSLAQESMLAYMMEEYISSANDLIDYCSAQVKTPRLSSASFNAALPSAVKN